jgi:hypothetical protein
MVNLYRKFLNLLGRSNDWEIVWKDEGIWQTNIDGKTLDKKCIYFIEHSEGLKSYRLKFSGYKPELHVMKTVAEMRLIMFNKSKT